MIKSASQTKTIRWVLAHEPTTTFEAAARRFSELLAAEEDQLKVDVFSASDFGRKLSPAEVIAKVASGEIEMCQTYTSALAKHDERLYALDLPFLFQSHEHAARALDGATGQDLMTGMLPRGLRGLAFTYSGGFRCVATTGATLESAAAMKGLRVRTGESPVPEAFFSALGAVPVPAPLDRVGALAREGAIDAAETTYPRYWDREQPKLLSTVVESSHSLLLTMMVVNERFYQGLTAVQRERVHDAAREAARIERATSIAEGEQVKARCPQEGVTLAGLPARELLRWRKAGDAVRAQFAQRLGAGLVSKLAA